MTHGSEEGFRVLEADGGHELAARDTGVVLPSGAVKHALDARGVRHLLVPLADEQAGIEDVLSRGVTIRTHALVDRGTERRYLDVACEASDLRDLFAVLCDEMLTSVAETPAAPAPACKMVLDRWRELLRRAGTPLLGREMLAGLLAELHVLERLAEVDMIHALLSWTGPDRARVDFMGCDARLEVKATTQRDRLVAEIHGSGQLDNTVGGLHLTIERLEPVPAGGDSVPDAIRRLLHSGVDPAALDRSLAQCGYAREDDDAYAAVQFRHLEQRWYRIDDDFPRIVRGSFVDPQVLDRVTRLNYVLDLTARPPIPLSESEVGALIPHLIAT